MRRVVPLPRTKPSVCFLYLSFLSISTRFAAFCCSSYTGPTFLLYVGCSFDSNRPRQHHSHKRTCVV
ncbi:hypothetical protein CSUI_011382 [Cystoisospora suis]|uniref:Secreted protein n=1 Tax=Cystoisospora suis TaxID=483139 RepID=A0A2C6JSN5_9APIC|nr:hypothetical protein CSUI_011382 [Cystoisospora suis]